MFDCLKRLFGFKVDHAIADEYYDIGDVVSENESGRGLPDFNSMTKVQIDDWAAANGIQLDRRKKKEVMITELESYLK